MHKIKVKVIFIPGSPSQMETVVDGNKLLGGVEYELSLSETTVNSIIKQPYFIVKTIEVTDSRQSIGSGIDEDESFSPSAWKAIENKRNSIDEGWKYAFYEFPYDAFFAMVNKSDGMRFIVQRNDLRYAFYNFSKIGADSEEQPINLSKYFDFRKVAIGGLFSKCFFGARVSKVPYINLSGCSEESTANMFSSPHISEIFIKISGETKFGTINTQSSIGSPFYNAKNLYTIKLTADSDIKTSINLADSSNLSKASFSHEYTPDEPWIGVIDALHDFRDETKKAGEGCLTIPSNIYDFVLSDNDRNSLYAVNWTVSVV